MTEKHARGILIADDDSEDIELIVEAINSIAPQIDLYKFNNGYTVIEYLDTTTNNELPAVVVLDYNMPGLTGAEVLRHMKKHEDRFRSIIRIVWSSSNSPLYLQECLSNGAKEYIVKPANIQGLQRFAENLVDLCNSSVLNG